VSALLEVSDLCVSFGGVHAVDHVSLDVEQGSIVGLIGPNGAGKTTLFECVAGFTRAASGHVKFDGKNVSHMGPEHRAKLGMIRSFQDARLFPSLTVFESILVAQEKRAPSRLLDSVFSLPNERSRERKKAVRVDELIEAMGLASYRDKFIREISTGTRRIAELACVLALEPKLLLLDEPSAGIAQKEVEALGAVLRRIKDLTGATMFIIEHDMPLIMGLAETIIALESGSKIAQGTPTEIQQHPEVIASYLGSNKAVLNRSSGVEVPVPLAAKKTEARPAPGHGRQTAQAPAVKAPPGAKKSAAVKAIASSGLRPVKAGKRAEVEPGRCRAETASGQRCRRSAVEGSDYCALPAHRRLGSRV